MTQEKCRYTSRTRVPHGVVSVGLALFGGVLLLAFMCKDDRQTNTFVSPSIAAESDQIQRTGRFFRGQVIASDPSVLRDRSGYRMFYTELDPDTNRTVIAGATSQDGLTWTPLGTKRKIAGTVLAGRDAEWDQNLESAEAVATENGFLLYFSGYRDEGKPMKGFPAALWVAQSKDGVIFERVSGAPVLAPSEGWYDNDATYSPTVLKTDTGYLMLYVGHAYTDFSRTGGVGGVFLLCATSPDGLTWTKFPQPILRPGAGPDWIKDGIAEPAIVKGPDGRYLLFFTGLQGEERRLGLATAGDPKGPWTIRNTPLLQPGAKGTPDEDKVLAPSVLIENGRIRMWYLAADKKQRLSVGLAEGDLSRLTR